jgi:ribonuclease J
VQQVCDAAVGCGRKVVVTGRSMVNNTKIARELGYLKIDEENIVDAYSMGNIPPEKVVVLSTGSQGEPLSALARMANGDHKTVRIEEGDTVVISATPVPGNEKAVSRVINKLAKAGAIVKHAKSSS